MGRLRSVPLGCYSALLMSRENVRPACRGATGGDASLPMSSRGGVTGALYRALNWNELYHPRQGVGRAFKTDTLSGYFNDLTPKIREGHAQDSRGIPLLRTGRRDYFYHPTAVCQHALGCYDRWLLSRAERYRRMFLASADWLAMSQDSRGGWRVFSRDTSAPVSEFPVGLPTGWTKLEVPYSGMVQGQAVSVLVRAAAISPESAYADAASRAMTLLRTEVRDGGVCYSDDSGISVEEVPSDPRNTILNGWIFGMFGAWDHWLATQSPESLEFFELNRSLLAARLTEFDLGWWSVYDELGHLAKPFYHRLHVAQLAALALLHPADASSRIAVAWAQVDTPANSARASSLVFLQRLQALRQHVFAVRNR